MPSTIVKTGAGRPTLAIKGAPPDALLYVDGLLMGPASQYNGENRVLPVEEGAHQVQIRQGMRLLYGESVFSSGGEAHTITITAGGN